MDDYMLGFGLIAIVFALFTLMQTLHTFDATLVQVEQAEAVRAQPPAPLTIEGEQLRVLLEQSWLDPALLRDLTAALRDRTPPISLSVVALHEPSRRASDEHPTSS
jgi:hypothetical protein